MQNSTLIKLISQFNQMEWKRFDKFVRSPYFNSNNSIIQLFEVLKRYYPNFDTPKLDKQRVFQKLFPSTTFKEKRLAQLMSDLKSLAEQFLVAEKTDRRSMEYQIKLKDIYLEKSRYNAFMQKSLDLEAQLQATQSPPIINQLYLHQLNDTWYYNNQALKNKASQAHLENAFSHLQAYYYFQQLKYACEWYSRKLRRSEEMPKYVQQIQYLPQFSEQPLYQLYYDTYLLFSQPQSDFLTFEKLSNTLKAKIHLLPKKHQIALILYLINYAINLSKNTEVNRSNYRQITFELYKLGLEENRIIYKGVLGTSSFINIAALACSLKAFDWLDTFIATYLSLIPAKDIPNSQAWIQACIAFHKGNFSKTIQIAESFYFKNEWKDPTRRFLQIRACLACIIMGDHSYHDLLEKKSNSFEKYLQRKTQISATRKTIYQNNLQITKRLSKLVVDNQPTSKFDQLYQQVLTKKEILTKEWLLEQILLAKQTNRQNKFSRSPTSVRHTF